MHIIYIANLRLPTEKAHGVQIVRMCSALAQQTGDRSSVTLVVPFRWRTKMLRGVTDVFAYYGAQKNFRILHLPSLDLSPLVRIFPFFDKAAFALQYGSFLISCFIFLAIRFALKAKSSFVYTRDSRIARVALRFTKNIFLELHTIPKQDDVQTARRVQGVIAVTHALKGALVEQSVDEKNILVAPDAVDYNAFDAITASPAELRKKLRLPLDATLIGYSGRLKTFGQEKGIPELLEAFCILLQEQKNARLVLVGGDAADAERFAQFLRERNLVSRVHFINHVPPTQVPAYLKSFDVLVAPFPKTAHYETAMSPLKIFEYMASGVPMVASDLPSLREVLTDDSAYFFEPGNAKDLARILAQMLVNPAQAAKKAEHAKKLAQQHTWDGRVQRILDFIAKRA